MRDLVSRLLERRSAGESYAVASVVQVVGSAPRQPGAALAVLADGTVLGSVSGGCVEGAVYELAQEVLVSGRPRLARFGYSADDAFAIGLTCGGELEVFVQAVTPERETGVAAAQLAAATDRPVALARVVEGPADLVGGSVAVFAAEHVGSTGDHGLDATVITEARGVLDAGRTGTLRCGPRGECDGQEVRVLVESWSAQPRLLVFGAIDYAAAVAEIGAFLGYRVTVCDARGVFATPQRFPAAQEVVVDWPHRYLAGTRTDRRTAVCVLTHDPKFDVPLLVEALRRPLGYVGALGSRRTHADRLARLRAVGLGDAELARLRSPIGLDLGARTPEETAVSIAAELIAARRGGSGLPLSTTDFPIHREQHDTSPPSHVA
ncbi:XdhC family protein [Solihabitans fulvus]|uniref:XdhC family protein n=1 Tax=Solihabitans fulvus TaxID=1892852 RepID=A0A5B2WZP3_9PSEU|nr:XdhC/CoxI family protein [Solihabitans fulvus]KAA2256076.1 XdhC family protein [Solihabitans fulvus]